jgi:hypothetical protein
MSSVCNISGQTCSHGYRESYARHFQIWKEQGRRHAVLLARVAAEPEFHDALRSDALRGGAVEWAQ